MKILIYVPLSPVTPKIFGRALQSIFRIEWKDKVDIVFGKNETPNPKGKYTDICDKHNEARALVLDNNYDAVFFIENDMIIPPDALEKLMKLDTDVGYGLYCSRHGNFSWLAFANIDGYGGLSYSQSKHLMQTAWGRVLQTEGVGMGCTLIHRHVLEKLNFRTVIGDAVADDWLFATDCKEFGFIQTHDFSIVCGHITPNSSVLWPTVNGHQLEFPESTEYVTVTNDKPYSESVGMGTKIIYGKV